MKTRCLSIALAVSALTACGSTVPLAQQGQTSQSGQAGLGGSGSSTGGSGDTGTTGDTSTGGDSGTTSSSTGGSTSGTTTTGSLGAIGSSGSTSTTGTSGTTSETSSSGGSTGGTGATSSHVTKPITIGFLNTGSSAALAASFGKKGNTVSWEGTDQALIKYYNAHGGIGGRQIKPVFYTVQTTSGSFANDTQAACAKFTQDNHVDLVMTTAGTGSFDNYESCLNKAHVVNLEAYDQGNTDLGTLKSYPGVFTVGAPVIDNALSATLNGLTRSGYLTKSNKIGVIVEDCPYNVRAFQNTYAPLAKRLGLSVTRRDVGCVDNATDLGTMLSQASAAVLPFRSAGIDRVSFISDFESVLLLGISDQAQSQGWKPGYALTSAAHAGSYAPQLAQGQLPQMHGVGNLPNVDVSSRGALSVPTKRCRARLTSEGVTGAAAGDFSILDTACDIFTVLNEALAKSNGLSTTSALITALHSIGKASESAAVVAGTTTYSASQRDGAPLGSVFAYQNGGFRYTTPPAALS